MNEPADTKNSKSPRGFHTTHWSLVTSAAAGSRAALGEICSAYWPPLFWYLRRIGYSATEAEDLTQAFFTQLLEKRLLGVANHGRGRFRTFLLTALRRFVVNEWKRNGAAKRGGRIRHFAISAEELGQDVGARMSNDLTPDRLFERQWGLVVLQRALHELEVEHRDAGKETMFEALAPCLTDDTSSPGYDELADHLQAKPAALRMAVSRLRKRLGELVRAEIRKTVDSDTEIDNEIRNLFRALQA